jgi:selenocysteine lyase/cysteine desulfurase
MVDWSAFRAQFPVTQQWAFFDHAAVAPLPLSAVQALTQYSHSLSEQGIAAVGTWVERIRAVRSLAARLINAPASEDICFIPNTTFGIGIIAEGFPWEPGDNVVTAAEEYPSNQYPWMNLARRGVEVRAVPSQGNRVAIDDLLAAMDARTRVLTISAVEFASGFRNDLAALGELCQSRGIFFFVDAIQALGVIPVDVQALPIDALAADGHKWMLGPEGAGFGYIRREWVERLQPVMVGWNSVVNPIDFNTIDFRLKPHAGCWEGGAYNVPGITALGASLELLLDTGVTSIWQRVQGLTQYLCDKAASAGCEVFSSRAPGEDSGIVSLTKPGHAARDLMRRCREVGIIVNDRQHRLRVSPHAYNTEAELDALIAVLASA